MEKLSKLVQGLTINKDKIHPKLAQKLLSNTKE
jgi:hypothetical protein